MNEVKSAWFANRILKWYRQNGRQDLPWKQRDPYPVWLSEIMLQQTQVDTVTPYFARFIDRFANIEQLAKAPLDAVLQLWSGLGYYARARNLHKTAQIIVSAHRGQFPRTVAGLMALPGIGRSTAGAILAQAFGIHAPILDGNVKRVLARFHAIKEVKNSKVFDTVLWDLTTKYTPKNQIEDYTQGIMDMGATLCRLRKPLCSQCPLKTRCQAYLHHQPEDFPVKQAKKSVPERECYMLVATTKENAILLEQRPLQGIWGGLYSFPTFDTQAALKRFCQKTFKQKMTLTALDDLQHVFTHFKLLIHPIRITPACTTKTTWFSHEAALNLALPTPIKKILTRLGV